uniref:Uncharacterized protein n=1 Tax=Pipistrellus kuhlii TaxID=59472 RepID=A0A7J7XB48_PIPKU|nr:hypothetical protein mPipKuh1_010626 [Pipistrellus kuhlii]
MDRPALTSAGGAGVQWEGSLFPTAALSRTTGIPHTCVDTAASTSQPSISTSLSCALPLVAAFGALVYLVKTRLKAGPPVQVQSSGPGYPGSGEAPALGECPCPPGPRLPATRKRAEQGPQRWRGAVCQDEARALRSMGSTESRCHGRDGA